MTAADHVTGPVPWRAVLAETEARLAAAGLASPAVDARRLVEECSGHVGADFVLGLDEPAGVEELAHLDALVARRVAGEPLQYVHGRWSFRTLDLRVDSRVLIPRPETEQVCGFALAQLDRWLAEEPVVEAAVVADLGAGSGALGLAIAEIVAEAPRWLAPSGALVVEIGETQGDAVSALARAAGYADVEIHADLNDRDRALVARLTHAG